MRKIIKFFCVMLCFVLIFPVAAACSGDCTITFDIGEDAGMMEPMTVAKGTAVTEEEIEKPELTGYSFEGWYIENDKVEFPYTIKKSVKFTAQWNINTYSITYNLNGGAGVSNRTYTINDLPFNLPGASALERANYSFGGWYSNSDLTGTSVTRITVENIGNKIYYVKWIPDVYSIVYNLNGGAFPTGTTVLESYSYGSIIRLPFPEKAAASFGGWFTNEQLNGEPVEEINGATGDKEFWAAYH